MLDLQRDQLWVLRDPTAEGYASVRNLRAAKGASARWRFPDVTFTVDEILG